MYVPSDVNLETGSNFLNKANLSGPQNPRVEVREITTLLLELRFSVMARFSGVHVHPPPSDVEILPISVHSIVPLI